MHILGIILLCAIYSVPIIAVLLADSRIGREAGVKLKPPFLVGLDKVSPTSWE